MDYTPEIGETVTVTVYGENDESLVNMTGEFISDETNSFGIRTVTVANQFGNQWVQPTSDHNLVITPVDNR